MSNGNRHHNESGSFFASASSPLVLLKLVAIRITAFFCMAGSLRESLTHKLGARVPLFS
jgi:hypothetical protein